MNEINISHHDYNCEYTMLLISDDNKVIIKANITNATIELYCADGKPHAAFTINYDECGIANRLEFIDGLKYFSNGHEGKIVYRKMVINFTEYNNVFWNNDSVK